MRPMSLIYHPHENDKIEIGEKYLEGYPYLCYSSMKYNRLSNLFYKNSFIIPLIINVLRYIFNLLVDIQLLIPHNFYKISPKYR